MRILCFCVQIFNDDTLYWTTIWLVMLRTKVASIFINEGPLSWQPFIKSICWGLFPDSMKVVERIFVKKWADDGHGLLLKVQTPG